MQQHLNVCVVVCGNGHSICLYQYSLSSLTSRVVPRQTTFPLRGHAVATDHPESAVLDSHLCIVNCPFFGLLLPTCHARQCCVAFFLVSSGLAPSLLFGERAMVSHDVRFRRLNKLPIVVQRRAQDAMMAETSMGSLGEVGKSLSLLPSR